MNDNNNYCVIMAGGIGSRFWPLSRTAKPKQFIDFFDTGKTLLRQTYERFTHIVPADHIIISTNLAYTGLVMEQIPELPVLNILHEPAYKRTAPSMALAAYHIRTLNPEANIVMVPADQSITDEEAFRRDILQALDYVDTHDHLVTIGIKPTRPETRYGYIQIEGEGHAPFSKIKTFTEKPQPEFAQIFVDSGEFYWNTGLFIWNARTIIQTMRELLPEMITHFDVRLLPSETGVSGTAICGSAAFATLMFFMIVPVTEMKPPFESDEIALPTRRSGATLTLAVALMPWNEQPVPVRVRQPKMSWGHWRDSIVIAGSGQ